MLVFPQDTVGPMTRNVRDAVTVVGLMAGYDPADSLTVHAGIAQPAAGYAGELDASGLKRAPLGLVTNALGSDSDPFAAPVYARVREAVAAIRAAGGHVVDLEIPDLMQHLRATSLYVNCSRHDINAFLAARPEAP
jgi:Asp-tRNA(Asn)/Glu-tRNA(Gln) amidotransferase A subunit family amidase